MKNTYAWTSKDGHKFELIAEFEQTMVEEIEHVGGNEYKTGKQVVRTKSNLTAVVDGNVVEQCWQPNFWQTIEISSMPGTKRIWGIKKIGFSESRAAEIDKFLTNVIEQGKLEATKAAEATVAAKREAELIASLELTVKKAESQSEIMTKAERAEYRRMYNKIHNEGGYGYVPMPICLEEYEYAKAKLAELKGGCHAEEH